MGKAAAAYYKELKNGGLPDQVAVKLTEEYMRTFTSLGDMLSARLLGIVLCDWMNRTSTRMVKKYEY
jgi:hypothetical protein